MKRALQIIALLVLLISPAVIVSGQAAAVDIFDHTCDSFTANSEGSNAAESTPCKDVKTQNSSSSNPIVSIIKAAIDIVSKVVGMAAVIGIIVSSIRLIIANGDSNSVASARTGLLYSLIGVAVTVLAQVIVAFVLKDVN